jgi:hypothetical protein
VRLEPVENAPGRTDRPHFLRHDDDSEHRARDELRAGRLEVARDVCHHQVEPTDGRREHTSECSRHLVRSVASPRQRGQRVLSRQHLGQRLRRHRTVRNGEVVPPQPIDRLGAEDELETAAERIRIEQQRLKASVGAGQSQRGCDRRCARTSDASHDADQACFTATVECERERIEGTRLVVAGDDVDGAQRDGEWPGLLAGAGQQQHVVAAWQLGADELGREIVAHHHDRRRAPRPPDRDDAGRDLRRAADGGAPTQGVVEHAVVSGGDERQGEIH